MYLKETFGQKLIIIELLTKTNNNKIVFVSVTILRIKQCMFYDK